MAGMSSQAMADMRAAHSKHGVVAEAVVASKPAPVKRAAQKQLVPIEKTFTLTSRTKTPASLVFGQGFPVGFAVDGFETPEITLLVGKVYNFSVISGCSHPFYLSNDPRGRGRLPILEGWVDQFGDKADPPTGLNGTNQICGGASILWQAQASEIGQVVTYQCFVHDNMGFTVNVQGESICDANVDRLANTVLNAAGLIGNIINNLLFNLTSTDKSNLLIDYFDGTIGQPLNLTDKHTNGAALANVQQGFVSFFGELLGCSDGSIPPYTGLSMAQVHANMPIGATEYGSFVASFQSALNFLSFNQSDIDAVTTLLNSATVKAGVCNFEADCLVSLCNTYSKQDADGNIAPGANEDLVNKIVNNLFAAIGTDQILLPFFNGSNPVGSANIVGSTSALDDLKARFVAFFGSPLVLACSDPNFPLNATSVQSLSDLQAIHANIPIDQEDFNEFLTVTTTALTQAGFSNADAQSVSAIFNSTVGFICNQPGCPGNLAQTGAEVFVVGVALKQSSNIWFGTGFPSGYTLNGVFNQGLILVAGQQYVFQGNTSCFHPFYLTTGFGSGSTEVTEGVIQGVGQNTCLGKSTIFQPNMDQVGQQIFYQCRNHQFMGGLICVVPNQAAVATTTCVFNQASLATTNAGLLSPCDEYTQAVQSLPNGKTQFPNSFAVLQAAMNDAFVNVFADPTLKTFFAGTFGSKVDFTQTVNTPTIATDYAQFLGTDLGCSDNSVPKYTSTNPPPDMKSVHAGMNIQEAQFDAFNTILLNEFTKFQGMSGVGMSSGNLGKVSAFLSATSADICATCDGFQAQSLCEKWTQASATFSADQINGQTKLVTAIVTATFTSFTNDPLLIEFFNSSVPCQSRDFINNAINRGVLVNQLTAFFGSAGVLGCTQPSFPQYTGQTDMGLLHQAMPISNAIFNFFNQQIINAIQAQNVASTADITAVQQLLASPAITVICNQADCASPHGTWVQACTTDTVPVFTGSTGTTAPGNNGNTNNGGTNASGGTNANNNGTNSGTNQAPVHGAAASAIVSALVVALAAISAL